jgi:hypothetical protein
MIEKSAIGRFELNNLPTLLPDIFVPYTNKLRSIQVAGKPKHALEFAIETLCDTIMRIYKNADTKTKKLREEYITYILARITNNERVLTKHGRFSWDVFSKRGTKLYSEDSSDSNTRIDEDAANMGNIDLDEMNDEERAEFTDTSSLFDTSAYDMEDGVYGDDDEDNGAFKSEGYGMD